MGKARIECREGLDRALFLAVVPLGDITSEEEQINLPGTADERARIGETPVSFSGGTPKRFSPSGEARELAEQRCTVPEYRP
jgi:hypothetical protein